MRRSIIRHAWLPLMTLVLAGCAGTSRLESPDVPMSYCWTLKSGKATVHLLGSIHMGTPDMFPLDPAIEAAFDGSDFLVVEVNIQDIDQEAMGSLFMSRGMYTEGGSLEQDVSKETYAKLKTFLEKRGVPLASVQKQRPWFVSLMLTMQEIAKLGFDAELGIDVYFLGKASKARKEILELEKMMDQMNLLSSAPKDQQEKGLLMAIENLHDIKGTMDAMKHAWLTGDPAALEKLIMEPVRKDPSLAPAMRALFDDRNVRMAEKIKGYLKTDKTYFVVVGAGHLCGKMGIITLLRKAGYEVRQLPRTRASKKAA